MTSTPRSQRCWPPTASAGDQFCSCQGLQMRPTLPLAGGNPPGLPHLLQCEYAKNMSFCVPKNPEMLSFSRTHPLSQTVSQFISTLLPSQLHALVCSMGHYNNRQIISTAADIHGTRIRHCREMLGYLYSAGLLWTLLYRRTISDGH